MHDDLICRSKKASESLADPEEYTNLFDDWWVAIDIESKISERNLLLEVLYTSYLVEYCSLFSFLSLIILLNYNGMWN